MDNNEGKQKYLDPQRVAEFYHANFVADQVSDFVKLVGCTLVNGAVIADVGGGFGYFANALTLAIPVTARVLDTDPVSIKHCLDMGIEGRISDALAPYIAGDEDVVCFNLMLHHLVANSTSSTRDLQMNALAAWKRTDASIYVNEYIYESYLWPGYSAYLIWLVTSSGFLSAAALQIGRIFPSLRANTLKVGVRFRTALEWKKLFHDTGFETVASIRGTPEKVSLPRRCLLIKSCRRDSFLLRPISIDQSCQ